MKKFTLTLETSELTMRKLLNLCADLKDKGSIASYAVSPEPKDRSDIMDNYEILFILPKDTVSIIPKENIKEYPTIKMMLDIIKKDGGETEKIESWGKKRLAFEIGEENYGDYVLIAFASDRKTMRKIDKFCREAENPKILRHMIIRKDSYNSSSDSLFKKAV